MELLPMCNVFSQFCRSALLAATALSLTALGHDGAHAADMGRRTIGYVLTTKYWAVYATPDGKTECPHGFNDGPREQFTKLFPKDGRPLTLLDTALAREADTWFPAAQEPMTEEGPLPWYYARGKTAIGLNLDGKVGPNDFVSPEGEPGIDNQLYRAIGCVAGFRPEGPFYFFFNEYMQRYAFNRVLMEISGVDDLINDDDVTVTLYRGLDPLITSADGKDFLSGSSQRIDSRWGQRYVHRLKGKIVQGVLTTEPADITLPYANTFDTNPDQTFKAGRLRLKLTPSRAEGLLGGYVDVEEWHRGFAINWSSHHVSYGQGSIPSIARALRQLADAYPDPVTGKNTAISSALQVQFVQAFILHSPEKPPSVAVARPASSDHR
jgi:hypothetical protein